jgi:hypothetical protein
MPCRDACPDCAQLRAGVLQIVGETGIDGVSLAALSGITGHPEESITPHYPSAVACLYDAYEEVSRGVLADFEDALQRASSWDEALTSAGRRLLWRMAGHPDEARLCFVEILRGDRELLRRREAGRRRLVDVLQREFRRRRHEGLPDTQIELLVGAGFHAIAARVAAGEVATLPEIEPELCRLAYVFEPLAA